MDPVETFEHNGFTVTLYYDTDCTSPRDEINNGLFLGFEHRRYRIGDEQANPGSWMLGEGDDEREVRTLQDLVTYVREHYDVVGPVLPVGMIDHSGVAYYIGSGAHPQDPGGWDSGLCGLIFATRARLDECQGEGVTPSDEDLTAWLTSEIEEFSRWASGDCYGYVITDLNGDEVGSCWGFIGSEYATEQAKEACPGPEDQPAQLITVRLTDATLDVIEHALSASKAQDYHDALDAIRKERDAK